MSRIPALLEDAADDFRTLTRQYMELTNLKVKDSARSVLGAGTFINAASLLVTVAIAELVVALAIWLIAPDAGPAIRIAAVAGLLTSLFAAVAGLIGVFYWKRIDVDPRLPTRRGREERYDPTAREDTSWQTIT